MGSAGRWAIGDRPVPRNGAVLDAGLDQTVDAEVTRDDLLHPNQGTIPTTGPTRRSLVSFASVRQRPPRRSFEDLRGRFITFSSTCGRRGPAE